MRAMSQDECVNVWEGAELIGCSCGEFLELLHSKQIPMWIANSDGHLVARRVDVEAWCKSARGNVADPADRRATGASGL